MGRAQLAQHVGGGADIGVFQPRQRGAADAGQAGQLIQRPAALLPQRLQPLGDAPIQIGINRCVFHIREFIPNMENDQAQGGHAFFGTIRACFWPNPYL
ncbi:hypothetical protein D3C78_1585110 [compost metagenome]